jgi:hypothetical protein
MHALGLDEEIAFRELRCSRIKLLLERERPAGPPFGVLEEMLLLACRLVRDLFHTFVHGRDVSALLGELGSYQL